MAGDATNLLERLDREISKIQSSGLDIQDHNGPVTPTAIHKGNDALRNSKCMSENCR